MDTMSPASLHGSNKNTDTEHCYGQSQSQSLIIYHFSLLLCVVKTLELNRSGVKTFLDKEILVLVHCFTFSEISIYSHAWYILVSIKYYNSIQGLLGQFAFTQQF